VLLAWNVHTSGDLLATATLSGSLWLSLCLTSLMLGHGLAAILGIVGMRRLGHEVSLGSVMLLPVYWLSVSLAAWRAVLQLVLDPGVWEKTEHRLARMPSSGLPT